MPAHARGNAACRMHLGSFDYAVCPFRSIGAHHMCLPPMPLRFGCSANLVATAKVQLLWGFALYSPWCRRACSTYVLSAQNHVSHRGLHLAVPIGLHGTSPLQCTPTFC